MKKRVLVVMLLVLLFIVSICGCSQKSETNNTTVGTEELTTDIEAVENDSVISVEDEKRYPLFRYAISAAPDELVPWSPYGEGKKFIYQVLYESLFDVIDDEYIPLIGKSYKIIDDLHYEVELFDYVYDTDGNHITADDIIYCYEYFAQSGFNVKYAAYESIEKIDDYTVMFTWTRPITGIGDLEHIFGNTKIYSNKASETHNLATDPVGTGPYKVTEYVSGSSVTLEADDNYWQSDEEYIHPRHYRNVQTIKIVVIGEASQNVVALQTGEIDFSSNITEEALPIFVNSDYAKDYTLNMLASTDVHLLGCDASNGVTSDLNFRKAVYYGLDNELIAEAVGSAYPLKSMSAPNYADANMAMDELLTYNGIYDPELAKEYLTETSYNGEKLTLLCKSTERAKKTATIIQALLMEIDINVDIKSLDNNLYNASLTEPDGYDLILGDIGGSFMIGSQNRICNTKDYGNGKSFALVDDPKLVEIFSFANMKANWNAENTMALFEYITDNAYYNYLFAVEKPMIYTKDVADAYIDPAWGFTFMPQACTYEIN